jgi:Cof subfamily protein (haloacid dehalogenase superfamily)
MFHYLATDLDGTFLNAHKTYDRDAFANLLSTYEKKGGHFIVASGRDWKHVADLFAGFEGRVSYVVDNGATVMAADGDFIKLRNITRAGLAEIIATVQQMPSAPHGGVLFFGHDHLYAVRPYEQVASDFLVWMVPMYGETIVVDSVAEIDEPILKATAFYGEVNSLSLVKRLADSTLLHATTPGMGVVDIMAAGVNKATGLALLLDHLGDDMTDLVVFGDGLNDVEMMTAAGGAYVMPNGDQKLLAAGFPVALAANTDSGVMVTWQTLLG